MALYGEDPSTYFERKGGGEFVDYKKGCTQSMNYFFVLNLFKSLNLFLFMKFVL